MILVLYGPDEYRRGAKLRDILAEFRRKHLSAPVSYIDFAEQGAVQQLQEFAGASSLFEASKLAVLEHLVDEGTKETAVLLKRLTEQKEFTIVVNETKTPTSPVGFLAKESAMVTVQKFEQLKGPAWQSFAAEMAKEKGVPLAPDALRFLAEVYAGNAWRLSTELDKLAGLSAKSIGRKDLEALGLDVAPEFWPIVNALKGPAPAKRLAALEELFAQNEPAQKIFHMVAYQWPEKLEQLAVYDRAVKSGKMDYDEALTDLVMG